MMLLSNERYEQLLNKVKKRRLKEERVRLSEERKKIVKPKKSKVIDLDTNKLKKNYA